MIVFDVGANDGTDSVHYATPGTTVHAFEPAPMMMQRIRARNHPRIVPVAAAVSNYDGSAVLTLAEHRDYGCSSLMEFRPFGELLQHWPGRDDLRPTGGVTVRVTRLDTYMRDNGIEHVDWLHCDAQGSDLHVLEGLGDLYDRVAGGVVEAARSADVAIYRDQPLLADIEHWLDEHGFSIVLVRNNDIPRGNEVNVTFTRR